VEKGRNWDLKPQALGSSVRARDGPLQIQPSPCLNALNSGAYQTAATLSAARHCSEGHLGHFVVNTNRQFYILVCFFHLCPRRGSARRRLHRRSSLLSRLHHQWHSSLPSPSRDLTAMDEFSDDGFDDLDDEVLDQLEENAIQATQAQKPVHSQFQPRVPQPQAPFQRPTPAALDDYSFDDDLDDTVVINESEAQRSGPAIDRSLPPPQHRPASSYAAQPRWNQHLAHQPLQPPPNVQRPAYPPRSQYPVPVRPNNAPGPSQRYPPGPASQRLPPQSQFARPPLPPSSRAFPAQSQANQAAAGGQHGIVAALQARLSALEAELTASKGEAAIIRSKYEKAQITHDSEVERLKKQSAELVAKQERAVEEAIAAGRSAATELQFTRHDLREERGRAKLRKTDTTSTTPKKNRTWGVADGFDGLEISVSPSKAQGQKRRDAAPGVIPLMERTPTKGKRKRPAVDSPTFALETHTGDSLFGTKGAAPEQALSRPGLVTLPYDVCPPAPCLALPWHITDNWSYSSSSLL
jgi:hypothetical protein